MLQDFDVEYTPVTRSPRGRGRGRSSGQALTSPGHGEERGGETAAADDGQLTSDDDVVTVDSVKLGKRFAPAAPRRLITVLSRDTCTKVIWKVAVSSHLMHCFRPDPTYSPKRYLDPMSRFVQHTGQTDIWANVTQNTTYK